MFSEKEINNIIESDISFDFISDVTKKIQEDMEKMYYDFLTANGYKIDKPYNMKQLEEIKADLKKQDKFLDNIFYTELDEEGNIKCKYMPFFNSIKSPISPEARNEIIEMLKQRKDNKGERNENINN